MKHDRSLTQRTLRGVAFLLLTVNTTSCVKPPRQYVIEDRSSATSSRDSYLDINKASVAELSRLPGIGKIMAERIVDHRLRYGNFRRKEHLLMVRGISERKFRALSPLISVQ